VYNEIDQSLCRELVWQNTNKLLSNENELINGIKTGITTSAGGCLATSYRIVPKEY